VNDRGKPVQLKTTRSYRTFPLLGVGVSGLCGT
jgi:hypothetical protein